MALRIPAAQVPFVKTYFQLINHLAENSPPGEDLVLERDLFSQLSNSQLEGFQRLIDYYHRLPNNTQNNQAKNNSNMLLTYLRNKNEVPPLPAEFPFALFEKYFGNRTEEELSEALESLNILCQRIGEFQEEDLPLVFSFAHAMHNVGLLLGFLVDMGINDVQELGILFENFLNYKPLDPQDYAAFTNFFLLLCQMDEEDRERLFNVKVLRFLKALPTHTRLREVSGLAENNLKSMVDYLDFLPNNTRGGNRRKARKTRKVRKA